MNIHAGRLHVGRGSTVGAVTVFPVWGERIGVRARSYLTVTDSATYSELSTSPRIPHLQATNAAPNPVLVLNGQLFEGGFQDRMATRSYLLAAGREQLIDVACVERDRWGGDAKHKTWYKRSPVSVRAGIDVGGQDEVWRRIAKRRPRSETESLLGAMGAAEEQARIVHRHSRLLAGQTGVLVGIGGVPLSLELFDSTLTLREQYLHIVRAAALDALGMPARPTPDRLARQACSVVERMALDTEPRVGQLARMGCGTSSGIKVMHLEHRFTTVHLQAANQEHPALQAA